MQDNSLCDAYILSAVSREFGSLDAGHRFVIVVS